MSRRVKARKKRRYKRRQEIKKAQIAKSVDEMWISFGEEYTVDDFDKRQHMLAELETEDSLYREGKGHRSRKELAMFAENIVDAGVVVGALFVVGLLGYLFAKTMLHFFG